MPVNRFTMRLDPPPGHKLIRDWKGKRVRTLRAMSSGIGHLPAGKEGEVADCGNGTGLHLKLDACLCCGVGLYLTRVSHRDVEVVSADNNEGILS